MGDPDRLLQVTSDADDLERELLASVRHVGPPQGAKAEGWAGIAAQLTAAVSVGAVGTAAHSAATAQAGATKALVAKVVVALAVGGSAVGAGGWYVHHRAELASSQTAISHEASSPSPQSAPAEDLAVSPSPEPALNAPAAPAETSAASPSSKRADNAARPRESLEAARPRESLEAESAMLTQARAELRGGDAHASMATLDKLRSQFPKGVLAQEREVLGIEVLAALGDAEGASRKARAFSDAHPNSPHTVRLRRFIIDP